MKKTFADSETPLLRFTSGNGRYRIIVLPGGKLGSSLADAHDLNGPVEQLFRQAADALALFSADLKQTMKMILQMKWVDAGISLEADWIGNIRGYIREPGWLSDQYSSSEIFGGTLALVRLIGSHPGYTGYTNIFNFNIRNALESYFASSEQRDTVFRFGEDRALMVQLLPGETQSDSETLNTLADATDSAMDILRGGEGIDQMAVLLTSEISRISEMEVRYLATSQVRIHCECSRQKIGVYIAGLPAIDKDDMYDNGPWPVVVRCDNCGSEYSFDRDEIGDMR